MSGGEFEVFVSKDDFRFNCAHFIAIGDFREKLHGHSYRVSVRLIGGETLGEDGYLLDFGDVKTVVRKLCKELNERFICPMRTKDHTVELRTKNGEIVHEEDIQSINQPISLCLECTDGSEFRFPVGDCALLPLYHSSAEELSHFLWMEIVKRMGLSCLLKRGMRLLEVSVAETNRQQASFRCPLPNSEEDLTKIGDIKFHPTPCQE